MLEIGKEIDALDNDEHKDNSYSGNLFEFVTDGSFVALYSAPNSLENLLVCKVHYKGNADDDLVDFYGHVVKSGDEYIKVVYLEKIKETKAKVIY